MQVSKWGNSLAVRLPKKLIDELGLVAGDDLKIVEATKDQLRVERADDAAEFLESMKQFRWPANPDYKFDRDEANET